MSRLRRGRFNRLRRRGAERRGGINLVSLMDIFTILVFFLLVNSSDVEVLPGNTSVQLPESLAEKKPQESLIIVVDAQHIVVQGRQVARLDDVLSNDAAVIEPLKQELAYQSQKAKGGGTGEFAGAVTIMGDKQIPYKVLKKIMVTCAESRYGNISLAVQQKAPENG